MTYVKTSTAHANGPDLPHLSRGLDLSGESRKHSPK
jgi:hypothetical protein